MILRSIREDDLDLVIAAESSVYPTPDPLTREILADWFFGEDSISEFGMIYETDGEIAAFAIIMPYTEKSYQKLSSGTLNELETTSLDFVTQTGKFQFVGLHFYHIHKYKPSATDLWKTIFVDLVDILQRNKLNAIAASALAVSSSGINLFYNTLNWKESDQYISNQHLMSKNGKLVIATIDAYSELEKLLKLGYEYKRRCKFLMSKRNEISPIWFYLGQSKSKL
jgi:hypothetical protein